MTYEHETVRSVSRRQAIEFVLKWHRDKYGDLRQKDDDDYCEKLGLLVDCITDMFPDD